MWRPTSPRQTGQHSTTPIHSAAQPATRLLTKPRVLVQPLLRSHLAPLAVAACRAIPLFIQIHARQVITPSALALG